MKIEEIDSNFKDEKASERKDGKDFYSIPCDKFALYGVEYDEKEKRFVRMPLEIAKQVSLGVEGLSKNTSGGRLRFSTDANLIELYAEYDVFCRMSHMPLLGSSGFTLIEERSEGNRVKVFRPDYNSETGYAKSLTLDGGKMRDYVLYFPLYNHLTGLKIAFNEGAEVRTGRKYRDIKPILYYGSSITQGGCTSRPDNCYQALISKWNSIDYKTLGFSGSARAEKAMLEYLPTIDCSVFVCDYDHNAPNAEYLKNTHYLLYETYRKTRPDTPILFISKPDFDYDLEGEEREKIVRETWKKAKKAGDNNVYFLSGKTLFGKKDRENCTVDSCHPNDRGFYLMAQKIYKKLIQIDEKYR